jgi:hypothetical protein
MGDGIHMNAEVGVAYKPFHNQLHKKGVADFMQAVACRALSRQELSSELPAKLRRFEQMLLHDSASFALHPGLVKVFPNRFKGRSPAGVESLADDQPVKLSISTDTASERDDLPPEARLSNKLLLADAGHVSLEYMADIERNGGYYLMRATKQLNPTITLALNAKEQEIKSLTDLKLKELLQREGDEPRCSILM